MTPTSRRELPVVGWREWLALPDLGVRAIKAKLDTGARTSSLHVFDISPFRRGGREWVRFSIHPLQRDTQRTVRTEAPVLEYRRVKSSSGQATLRPVVETTAILMGQEWPIEVTLANRDAMGFRMLLGRQAVRRRFWVDPGRSYYAGRPKRKKSKARKKTMRKSAKKKAGKRSGEGEGRE
jgi:hypothetical protein